MKITTMLWMITLFIIFIPITFANEQNLVYDQNGNLVSGDGFQREYYGFNQLIRIRNAS